MKFNTSFYTAVIYIILACVLFVTAYVENNTPKPSSGHPINNICLGCICQVVSGCNKATKCNGNTCGPLQITYPYWADAGKPTLQGESPDSETAFENCANDILCAGRSVQNYMDRYAHDCNGDGQVTCQDHATIHNLGRFGCKNNLTVSQSYYYNLEQCLKTWVG